MALSPALANRFKFVNGLIGATTSVGPADIDTDAVRAFDYVSMKNWSHATCVIQLGVTGAASAVTFSQATDVAGTSAKSLGFSKAWRNTTATGASDTLTEFAVSSDTFSTATGDGLMYVIEFDAEDLDVDGGFDCLTVAMADPAAATMVNILWIMSGGRYIAETPATAIT
jgi:hypothetical protein